VYDLSQLSMKFERHLDAEVIDFEVRRPVPCSPALVTPETAFPGMVLCTTHERRDLLTELSFRRTLVIMAFQVTASHCTTRADPGR